MEEAPQGKRKRRWRGRLGWKQGQERGHERELGRELPPLQEAGLRAGPAALVPVQRGGVVDFHLAQAPHTWTGPWRDRHVAWRSIFEG